MGCIASFATFDAELMTSFIAIDASFQWIRTALVEQGTLTDMYEESPSRGRLKGNIYKGIVRRIDPKIQAAFVRYGQGRDGFLPIRDAERQGHTPSLKQGDAVLVQVLKDEIGEKGAALTTRLSLSGRALVYLLDKDSEGGVSSRLGEEERSRLRAVLAALKIPEGASVILRTAALSKEQSELQEDLDRLSLLEKEIRDAFDRRKEPGLLWREAPPITRYLREYWQKSLQKVWVNTDEAFAECRSFFSQYEPEDVDKVELSADGPALFERLGLEDAIVRLDSPKVALSSGANIVIERTEALVSVDVNSSRSKTGGLEPEETLFKINCEAAVEVARQIRLRDLGGIIVVDFIDMDSALHRQELESVMRAQCAKDKAKVKVYGLSPLGLMEINRQRLRKIPETRELPICSHCQGTGRKEAWETLALKALRILAARLSERPGSMGGTLVVSSAVAAQLWNEHRRDLEDLEARFESRIRIQISESTDQQTGFQWTLPAKPLIRSTRATTIKPTNSPESSKKPGLRSPSGMVPKENKSEKSQVRAETAKARQPQHEAGGRAPESGQVVRESQMVPEKPGHSRRREGEQSRHRNESQHRSSKPKEKGVLGELVRPDGVKKGAEKVLKTTRHGLPKDKSAALSALTANEPEKVMTELQVGPQGAMGANRQRRRKRRNRRKS